MTQNMRDKRRYIVLVGRDVMCETVRLDHAHHVASLYHTQQPDGRVTVVFRQAGQETEDLEQAASRGRLDASMHKASDVPISFTGNEVEAYLKGFQEERKERHGV